VFLNPVFLRMALPGTLTVSKVIDIAAITVAEALEHADYPFDVLQEELKLRPPAIQVDYIPLFETDSDTRITDVSPVDTTSKFDLTIYVVEQREQLLVRLIYKTRAYTTQAITGLQERLLKVHDAFLKDPALPIDAIVPAAEAPKIRVGLKLQGTSHVG